MDKGLGMFSDDMHIFSCTEYSPQVYTKCDTYTLLDLDKWNNQRLHHSDYLFKYLTHQTPTILHGCKHQSDRQLLKYHYTSVWQTVTHRPLYTSLTDSYSNTTIHQSDRQLLIDHYTSVWQTVTHRPLYISVTDIYSYTTIHQSDRHLLIYHHTIAISLTDNCYSIYTLSTCALHGGLWLTVPQTSVLYGNLCLVVCQTGVLYNGQY